MKAKKYWVAATLLSALLSVESKAQHSLEKVWETEAVLQVPESVLFDKESQVLYVSLIDGKGGEKDGKGGVALVSTDGKVKNADWITGLNAPKGLGKYKGKLYIADLDEVVIADIATGKVEKKISVPEAKFLNDVTVDNSGNVYVSDSQTKNIFLIKDGTPSLYHVSAERPNGLLAVGKDLLILDSGSLYKLGSDKKAVKLAEGMEKSTDGIEEVKRGEYIVSAWIGVVYYVTDKGKVEQLLDTRDTSTNSADIGYDARKKIVYVPTFAKNSVAAYQLK
ncbi:MAG: ATP/GTP-binding protein [Cytophagaceae bacterium SCN 52-12]|nr:MAG: ATP/GTP-binding protein [Cytophagaceae bacterium SCN 52-12]